MTTIKKPKKRKHVDVDVTGGDTVTDCSKEEYLKLAEDKH